MGGKKEARKERRINTLDESEKKEKKKGEKKKEERICLLNESGKKRIENRPIRGSVIKRKKYKTSTQSNATSQRQMDTFCCCCIITEDILYIHSFHLPLTVKAVFIPPHKHERIEYKKEAHTRGNTLDIFVSWAC